MTQRARKEETDASDREAGRAGGPGGRRHEVDLIGNETNARPAPSTGVGRSASRMPVRPRLKQTIELVPASDQRLYLFRGGEQDFVVRDTPAVRSLLRLADGSRDLPTLMADLVRDSASSTPVTEHQIEDAVRRLAELGLIEDAADDDRLPVGVLERFDRQLRYFGEFGPAPIPRAVFLERLHAAHVTVLGLGGLGSWTALMLACAGIGAITGVDGDAVELSNLTRQALFREKDVGRPKAHVVRDVIRGVNSDVRFRDVRRWLGSEADVAEVVADTDFVVDAVDFPPHEIERWVNDACFRAGVPFVMMSQFPPLVRFGPTFVPGETGCYACQEQHWRRQFPLFDAVCAARKGVASPAASIAPACALIAAQAALDVVHYLSGVAPPATQGRSITLDLRTLTMSDEPLIAGAGCEICASTPASGR